MSLLQVNYSQRSIKIITSPLYYVNNMLSYTNQANNIHIVGIYNQKSNKRRTCHKKLFIRM